MGPENGWLFLVSIISPFDCFLQLLFCFFFLLFLSLVLGLAGRSILLSRLLAILVLLWTSESFHFTWPVSPLSQAQLTLLLLLLTCVVWAYLLSFCLSSLGPYC